jgi:3-hydroxy-D-aspartate aldolase
MRYDDVFSWHIPEPRHPNTFCGWDERRQVIAQAADKAGHTGDLLARHGIACPTITGAGTSTFEFETASGVYTELHCGSYIFMDADYGRNRDRDGGPFTTFEPSLLSGRR